MIHVSILVPENAVIQAIADPQYCFNAVNMFFAQSGKNPLFQVELVSAKDEVLLHGGQYVIRSDKQIKDSFPTNLIFVPAIIGDPQEAIGRNRELISWISDQYKNGAEVASLCLGAFLLASTGLLNGKKCSTHWQFEQPFRSMFPEVHYQDGSIVTEENGIYTSGGANSYWNLLLHLVEKYCDRETAILISKYFAIDISRNSQSVFAMFKAQKQHPDQEIIKVQEYIESNVEERITVEELAGKFAFGRRSFERRFRQATNNSVLEYIQRVKVEAAKRSFETSRKNINEVMYDVGYTDSKAFRSVFRKITGLTPIEYRNRYWKA